MKSKLTILVVAGALLAIAGISYAAIPGSNGTISACRDAQGRLKVIDAEAGQTCPSNQQLLAWNQQGPAGPQGQAGPQGTDGVLGTAFVSGAGTQPTSSLTFLSPTVQMTIAAGQRIHVVASKTLGSTSLGGGTDLDLFICYRSTVLGSPLTTIGFGVADLATPQNSRNLYTLSADFPPGVGTFNVGLCGSTPSPSSWNNNDNGYVTTALHE